MLVPTPFTLCRHQARPQRPSTAHSEWSLHPPLFLPEVCAPPPARPDVISPQDSALGVPPASTTHLPTPQHSPTLTVSREEQRPPPSSSQPACQPSGTT